MTANHRIDGALLTLKGMFQEVPGMRLTAPEAARLAGLEPDTCLALLTALEDVRFLRRSDAHTFVCATQSPERRNDADFGSGPVLTTEADRAGQVRQS